MAFTLRTDSELEAALDRLVEAQGVSRQEVVRRAVLDMAHRTGLHVEVEESGHRMIDRWGDVLDRLGSV